MVASRPFQPQRLVVGAVMRMRQLYRRCLHPSCHNTADPFDSCVLSVNRAGCALLACQLELVEIDEEKRKLLSPNLSYKIKSLKVISQIFDSNSRDTDGLPVCTAPGLSPNRPVGCDFKAAKNETVKLLSQVKMDQ
jgi:hypothetical protein